MNITKKDLLLYVNEKYFKRGEDIITDGMVGVENVTSDCIKGIAIGTGLYHISLQRSSTGISGYCTCPAFIDFGPCKHIAAVGLAYLDQNYEPSAEYDERKQALKDVLRVLKKKNKDELIALVIRIASCDPETMRMLEIEVLE